MAIDLLSLKMSLFAERHKSSTLTLLENYLASPELDFKDVIGVVCDFLLAGIDTVCICFVIVCKNTSNMKKVLPESLKFVNKRKPNGN